MPNNLARRREITTRGRLTAKTGATPIGALALAALCLLGQLSSFAHLGLVRHVTCLEHGELIHADGDAPDRQAGRAPSESGLPAYGAVPADPADHGHDHCLATTMRRECWVAPQSDVDVVAQPEQPIVTHVSDTRPVAAFALFRLAPKNSPPA